MFFYEVEGHMQKLSSFGRGKKIRPKKSLTWLLHEALQLIIPYLPKWLISLLAVMMMKNKMEKFTSPPKNNAERTKGEG